MTITPNPNIRCDQDGNFEVLSNGLWKPRTTRKNGQIQLTENGKRAYYTASTLVYSTFNPSSPPVRLKHIDGDKTNNSLSNLEPCLKHLTPREERSIRTRVVENDSIDVVLNELPDHNPEHIRRFYNKSQKDLTALYNDLLSYPHDDVPIRGFEYNLYRIQKNVNIDREHLESLIKDETPKKKVLDIYKDSCYTTTTLERFIDLSTPVKPFFTDSLEEVS